MKGETALHVLGPSCSQAVLVLSQPMMMSESPEEQDSEYGLGCDLQVQDASAANLASLEAKLRAVEQKVVQQQQVAQQAQSQLQVCRSCRQGNHTAQIRHVSHASRDHTWRAGDGTCAAGYLH